MTTAFDRKFRPLALKLLTKYGKQATLKRLSEHVYDPATSEAAVPPTSYACRFLLDKPSSNKADAGVRRNTRTGFLAGIAFDFEPRVGDLLVLDNENWQVGSIDPIYSGDLPALFQIGISK